MNLSACARISRIIPLTVALTLWTQAQAQAQSASNQATVASATSSTRTSEDGQDTLEEVLVTAEKKTERLQDVPVPVAVVDTQALSESNQLSLADYSSKIPGFSAAPTSSAGNQLILAIRGITTGIGTNPTVGVLVDDVPFGASTNSGGGNVIPDIDPGDLARIEVLRGPQGTLYGASSMGGLIKFVTLEPTTDQVSGHIQVGTSGTYYGASLGYNLRGSVNVPLSDTLAIRGSAFTREDPGYISDSISGDRGVNQQRVSGGRFAAKWDPSDSFSLKLSALYQYARADGSDTITVAPGLGELQQNYVPGVGGYYRRLQNYSAVATWKIWGVDLTSITGYNISSSADSLDYSYVFGSSAESLFNVGGVSDSTIIKNRKLTQELRISSSIAAKLDWLVGGFYTRDSTDYAQVLPALNGSTGAPVPNGLLLGVSLPTGYYEEYAGFADLTYHFTDRFDIQVGGRESAILQPNDGEGAGALTGALYGTVPLPAGQPALRESAFTYLLTPRLKLSSDLMLYARLASGYRPGAGSAPAPGSLCLIYSYPCTYGPDKTYDYDLGAKGEFFNKMLSIDASLYYIKWNDIQLQLVQAATGFNYTSNGGRAKSEGIELSFNIYPTQDLSISSWITYSDAALTQNFPSSTTAIGSAGDSLPNSGKASANLSVEQRFNLADQWKGFVGGNGRFVDNSQGPFGVEGAAQRQYFPSYTRFDLLAGVRNGLWSVNGFVNNLMNRYTIVGGGLGTYPPYSFVILQPRTVGINIVRSF